MQLLSAFLTYIGKVPKIRGVITLTKRLTILGISTLIIVCTVVALAFLLGYGDSSDTASGSGGCYAEIPEEELLRKSALIAVGTVNDIYDDMHGNAYSDFKIERAVKGGGAASVTVRTSVPYKNEDAVASSSTDFSLVKDERYLLFLSKDGENYRIINPYRYRIIVPDDGMDSVLVDGRVWTLDEYCDRLNEMLNE